MVSLHYETEVMHNFGTKSLLLLHMQCCLGSWLAGFLREEYIIDDDGKKLQRRR
jgi:hypothetical protein